MEVLQEQQVHIVDNRGAPPELIRLAWQVAKECKEIKAVIFDAFIDKLNGDLGAYDPVTGTIIIDMGACVLKKAWMKKGIMYIPNVWFNLVFTLFHEAEHALQLEEDPTLAELGVLPKDLEDTANVTAEISLLNWALEGTIPRLDELGWVGIQIKGLLNKLYVQAPQAALEEIAVEGTTAVSNAMYAALTSSQYADAAEIEKLLEAIDDGYVGVKVGGKRYLTAYDAINTTHEAH